jgi:hypothetical protein
MLKKRLIAVFLIKIFFTLVVRHKAAGMAYL